jgi:hypothetical protein
LNAAANVGRWVLVIGRWLIQSLVRLVAGWVPFFTGTKSGVIVGLVLVAFFIAIDETPGAQGSRSIIQLNAPDVYASIAWELFIIAVSVRLASGFRNRARRAGWIRFLFSWAAAGVLNALVTGGVLQVASTGGDSAVRFQISAAAGVTIALLAAGAIKNWSALAAAVAAQRSVSTARRTRGRILDAVSRRPVPLPAGTAYSLWYAWAACALGASPIIAHRAAEAAVSSLRSGADSGTAAGAAKRSAWTPAALIERLRY